MLAIFRFLNRIPWLCVRWLPFAIPRGKSLNSPNTESFEDILWKVVQNTGGKSISPPTVIFEWLQAVEPTANTQAGVIIFFQPHVRIKMTSTFSRTLQLIHVVSTQADF